MPEWSAAVTITATVTGTGELIAAGSLANLLGCNCDCSNRHSSCAPCRRVTMDHDHYLLKDQALPTVNTASLQQEGPTIINRDCFLELA